MGVCATCVYAEEDGDGIGQTIQINTRLRSFVGKPSWLIIVRDVDHGQNIPYMFDIRTGDNAWVIPTYSNNYLITVSNMQFAPYRFYPYRMYPYTSARINNFCHLESRHIHRNESLSITIEGKLTPNTNSFSCHVTHFRNSGL